MLQRRYEDIHGGNPGEGWSKEAMLGGGVNPGGVGLKEHKWGGGNVGWGGGSTRAQGGDPQEHRGGIHKSTGGPQQHRAPEKQTMATHSSYLSTIPGLQYISALAFPVPSTTQLSLAPICASLPPNPPFRKHGICLSFPCELLVL